MMAQSTGTNAAMNAAQDRSGRMPFAMSMGMCMTAYTSILLLQTDVNTSVSLFVQSIVPLLLVVGLVVLLISLLLTGLTRLVGLGGLVGLINRLAARTARGA